MNPTPAGTAPAAGAGAPARQQPAPLLRRILLQGK